MKAMILAAGLGTRLRPLTDDRPKAMVEVGGRTLLEITLARLREFGVREVIVNVHHFADMVVEYLKKNNSFGMRIEVSREEVLLDTGGGLRKAGWFFLEGAGRSEEPFILHNVDVISTIDLGRMVQFHRDRQALATLAVQDRETSRYLLFDEQFQLCGRRAGRDQQDEIVRPSQETQALAFSGIHVISPRLLKMFSENGVFSIIDSYLRLAGTGEPIVAYRADQYYWRDLGKPENVAQAAWDVKSEASQHVPARRPALTENWEPISKAKFETILTEEVRTLLPQDLATYKKYAIPLVQYPCIRSEHQGIERVFVVARAGMQIVLFDDVEYEFAVGVPHHDGILKKWDLYGNLAVAVRGLPK